MEYKIPKYQNGTYEGGILPTATGKYFAPIIGATGIGASTIKIPSRKKGGKFIKHK